MVAQFLKMSDNTTLRPIVGQNSSASNSQEFMTVCITGNARRVARLSLAGMSLLMASLFAGCSTMTTSRSDTDRKLSDALRSVEPDILGGKVGHEASKRLK